MTESDSVSLTHGALRLRWDVFLSFRGEDTRYPFVRDLYTTLENHGVRVFLDDVGLRRGDDIAVALISAIEDSAASIVVMSPRYADSWWCLEELGRISELKRLILPVFYRVDPSDVRRLTGPFEEHLREHERSNRFKNDRVKIERWRKALKKLPIDGWVVNDNSKDAEVIQSLLKRVLNELSKTSVDAYTVGLDSHVEELIKKMDVKFNGIQVLGIHGKSGVGKTTLAKNLYDKLAGEFESQSFIPNVREFLGRKCGFTSLLNRLVDDLSFHSLPPVNKLDAAINAIRWTVHEKRVLVVLDDVDDVKKLTMLLGNMEWFQEGSRIILIVRDKEVLFENVDVLYEVKELDYPQALQLFSYHALRREKPPDAFLELSKRIVDHIGRVPLALEVFGSFLHPKSEMKWEAYLKTIRSGHLQDVLRTSIGELDAEDMCIFLDIACLLVKREIKIDDVIDILNGCGFSGVTGIKNLKSRSLLKIARDNTIWMHNQVCDIGRQIDKVDRRLWGCNEMISVLKNEKEAGSIQGIVLDTEKEELMYNQSGDTYYPENLRKYLPLFSLITYLKEKYKKITQNDQAEERGDVTLCTSIFDKMTSLRLLQINHVKLKGKFKSMPAELKWLQWKNCSLEALPSDYNPQELAVLDLSESKNIRQLWGPRNNKEAKELLVMNLRGCCNLDDLPDLSGHEKLQKLVLEDCTQLIMIHKSIGNMKSLLHLNLSGCSNLTQLPNDLSGLKNLKILILSGCARLQGLPDISSLVSLLELLADETAIPNLPESIFRLTKLEKLSLNNCHLLRELPKIIGNLHSLKVLSLNGTAVNQIPDSMGSLGNLEKLSLMRCEALTRIPDSIGKIKSLKELLISDSVINQLPASIISLPNLKILSLEECHHLSTLPHSIGGLVSLVELRLNGSSITHLPEGISNLKLLRKLEMRKCRFLGSVPESIGGIFTLTSLSITEACIVQLPESIGFLENLKTLELNRCEKLSKLPASIGNLKYLQHLLMEETGVIELPESLGKLSSLKILRMTKTVSNSTREKTDLVVLPTCLSDLSLLNELNASAWRISGKIPDDFEKLTSLQTLNLGHNNFISLPSSLRGLTILKKLIIPHCKELKSLPPLPSSLLEVNIENCSALEMVSDLSNLVSLQDLNLSNCQKVLDIPGLHCLKSLRRFHMSGCNACFSAVKRSLHKICWSNLYTASFPGNRIPDWFSKDVVKFPEGKKCKVKGVILCAVLSLNLQKLPEIMEVQLKIVKHDKEVCLSTLPLPFLTGVPQNDQDQIIMYLLPEYHPIVSMLEHGHKIRVTCNNTNPDSESGADLKNCSFDLAFEGLDEKVAEFFGFFARDGGKMCA